MSWNDPCSKCGEPRYNCDCPVKPYTKEQIKKQEDENIRRLEGKKICEKQGHNWQYTFIVYTCERCGDTTDY